MTCNVQLASPVWHGVHSSPGACTSVASALPLSPLRSITSPAARARARACAAAPIPRSHGAARACARAAPHPKRIQSLGALAPHPFVSPARPHGGRFSAGRAAERARGWAGSPRHSLGRPRHSLGRRSHALDFVVDLGVELAQAVEVLLGRLPVAAPVRLEEGRDHVAEGVRVRVQQPLLHLRVGDEDVVGVLVDKVVDGARGRRPAHRVAQPLGDLTRALVAALEHTLVKLGVEQLGARVEAHRLRQRAHLRVGRRGVGDESGGLLAVGAETRHHLSRVRIEIVRDVRERDLGRVEVLEGHVDALERRLEQFRVLVEDAGLIGVEREALAREELFLQLRLILPAAVFDGQANVGRIGARRVGEDARGRLTQGTLHLLRLLEGVLAHKVLLERLVKLRDHLDGAVEQVHLVDEEVAEDARARDDDVDARPAQLLEWDGLEPVDTAERVRQRAHAHHPQHLSERLAVRLDVVGAPQHEGDRLGVGSIVVERLTLEQPVDDHLGAVARRRRRDGLRVERVHVLARRQHERVADRVAAGARRDELRVETLEECAHLVVRDDLLEAELAVLPQRRHRVVSHIESLRLQRLPHRRTSHHVLQACRERVDLGHATRGVGRAVDRGLDGRAHRLHNLLAQLGVGEVAAVRGAVDLLDVAPARLGDDACQRLDPVLRPID
mmetsp:Transcript_40413/g.111226  ORF Transcript_40413/g.111226 Transcript_40413/m.111226 type:complete len:672 (-) Transcript_40413:2319-4334(-)